MPVLQLGPAPDPLLTAVKRRLRDKATRGPHWGQGLGGALFAKEQGGHSRSMQCKGTRISKKS